MTASVSINTSIYSGPLSGLSFIGIPADQMIQVYVNNHCIYYGLFKHFDEDAREEINSDENITIF